MYDGACLSEPSLLQRAVGELRVAVKRSGPETVLDELRQAGCLKARFPRRLVPGWMDIVMLNTGGGVAGGDRLDLSIGVGAGAQATIAAQAAERFYRARAGDAPSKVRTHLTVEAGAALEWLPQETILFDQSAVDRRLEVDLAADARFLGVETIVFGRTAMGELVRQGWLRDLIRVRRGGDLLLHDAIRIDGDDRRHVAARRRCRRGQSRGDDCLRRTGHGGKIGGPSLNGAVPATAVAPSLSAAPSRGRTHRSRGHRPERHADRAHPRTQQCLGATNSDCRLAVLRENRPLPRVWLC